MDPSKYFSTFDNNQLGKIYKHYWKECLQFSEIAKFESDASNTSEEILQMFVWWGGGGTNLPLTYKGS